MFNEATYREIPFRSAENINDYVVHGMGCFYLTHQFIYDISGNIDGINITFCDFS